MTVVHSSDITIIGDAMQNVVQYAMDNSSAVIVRSPLSKSKPRNPSPNQTQKVRQKAYAPTGGICQNADKENVKRMVTQSRPS